MSARTDEVIKSVHKMTSDLHEDYRFVSLVVALGSAAHSAMERCDFESAKVYLDEMQRVVMEDKR